VGASLTFNATLCHQPLLVLRVTSLNWSHFMRIPTITCLSLGVALLVAFSIPNAASAQDGVRIGLVDLQRSLNTVNEGQAARERLESDMQRRQREFETEQAALESEAEEFEAALAMLTQEAAMQRYAELQERALTLQERFSNYQRELMIAEAEATEAIAEKMFTIVSEIAQEQGYTLVLDRSTVVYAAEGDDLTDELIRRYNARH